jgi:hypothetical protein
MKKVLTIIIIINIIKRSIYWPFRFPTVVCLYDEESNLWFINSLFIAIIVSPHGSNVQNSSDCRRMSNWDTEAPLSVLCPVRTSDSSSLYDSRSMTPIIQHMKPTPELCSLCIQRNYKFQVVLLNNTVKLYKWFWLQLRLMEITKADHSGRTVKVMNCLRPL